MSAARDDGRCRATTTVDGEELRCVFGRTHDGAHEWRGDDGEGGEWGEHVVATGMLITCPACHYVHRDSCDYPVKLQSDGDVVEMSCDHCAADLRVELAVTYEYTTVPA